MPSWSARSAPVSSCRARPWGPGATATCCSWPWPSSPNSGEPVLEDVVVLDAAAADDGYAASGLRRLVLAVPEDDAGRYYGLLGSLTDPLVSVAVRG